MSELKPIPGRAQLRSRSAQIRAIDQGTNYDVIGRLKAMARAIERGDYGRVTDVGIVVKGFVGAEVHMQVTHAGTGTKGDFILMAKYLEQRASR
jgi:hypothetical protein